MPVEPETGKFYISIPGIDGHPDGEGGVAVIDPKTKTVVNTFLIARRRLCGAARNGNRAE